MLHLLLRVICNPCIPIYKNFDYVHCNAYFSFISKHLGICAENIFRFKKAHNNHIRLQSCSKPLIFHKNYKYSFLLSQGKKDAKAIIVASKLL